MVAKSQRQYAHIHNAPAQRRARGLADAKGLPMPSFIEPALATLRTSPPKGEQWVHEIKYDGYRFQAHVREGQDRERKVRFLTRRGHDWSARLVNLRAPVSRLKTHAAILDGEVVVQGEGGATDFNELEREISQKGGSPRLVLYVFDLLYLAGLDLRRAPLIDRKAVLADLLATLGPSEPVIRPKSVRKKSVRKERGPQETCASDQPEFDLVDAPIKPVYEVTGTRKRFGGVHGRRGL